MSIPDIQHDPLLPPSLVEPADPVERERLLAEADVEAGNGASGGEVAAWLLELAAGRSIPPPCDR